MRSSPQSALDPQFLSPEEITDRLRISSPGIVEDLHAVALHNLQSEDQRELRLDAKAHVLLLASSIGIAAAILAGLLLRPHGGEPDESGSTVLVVVYFGTLLFGLLTGISAARVVFVTGDYRGADERDLLHLEELAASDQEYLKDKEAGAEEKGNVVAQGRYRRYLIAHRWQMWQQHFALHERKASALRRAQKVFVLFLTSFTTLGVGFGLSLVGGS